tara:strand:+ start:1060 stop:1830 length:771 start_codon:yes stop_codon:yes gene_type:complete
MLQDFFLHLSSSLNNTPVLFIWVFQIIFCYFSILGALKFFGKTGIYVYVALAIILANIQVLKVIEFPFFPEPMALGTILFISVFLCTDILNEYFDKKSATKCIYLGISAYLFSTIIMFMTISLKPIDPSLNESWAWSYDMHQAIQTIFLPQFPIIVASIFAFFISQKIDIFIFSYLKNKNNSKLWFRNNISTIFSQFIDNIIFSLLAFNFLSSNPVPVIDLIISYGIGIYLIRIALSIFDTLFIYLARNFLPKNIE